MKCDFLFLGSEANLGVCGHFWATDLESLNGAGEVRGRDPSDHMVCPLRVKLH